jgi:hypothetical protein
MTAPPKGPVLAKSCINAVFIACISSLQWVEHCPRDK